MRIVFFTNKSARGVKILKQIKQKNIPLEAIFIDVARRSARKLSKKVDKTLKRIGPVETLRLILKRIRMWFIPDTRKEWQSNDFYNAYADKVYLVKNFNGTECEQLLREIEPDIVVLGGSRILRKNIIRIPEIGILNAHPGLLPQYRGVDVIRWAIYNGDPVGVTIHFIDAGVDTGGIVARKTIDVTAGDTINSLMKRADEVAGELMSEAVLELIETGHLQVKPQVREDGKQYYRMPIKLRKITERKLQKMVESRIAA